MGITDATEDRTEPHDLLRLLREAATWTPAAVTLESGDALAEAQRTLRQVEEVFHNKYREIREAESYLHHAQGYRGEAEEQALRLQAIGLVSDNGTAHDICPVCASQLPNPPPSVAAISRSLEQIERNLRSVRREEPRLYDHLESLRGELEELRIKTQDARVTVAALVRQHEAARQLQETNTRAAHVVGRISLYLENVEATDENAALRKAVEDGERRVEELAAQLDPDEVEELKGSILNVISVQMSAWTRTLQLEHANAPYRLDDKRLTVIVDTPERPIVMERMGSGENWLGCHLIALLALHQHFIRRERPVPNFLFLDQPSQVYFPSEESYKALEGEVNNLEDIGADVLAVQRMFDFLFTIVAELSPNLQIIVTEHANLGNERFQQALVEEPWRGERALIPLDWLE